MLSVPRGVGEGGAGGAVAPPTFESWGAQPLQFFTSLCAPFLTRSYPSGLPQTPVCGGETIPAMLLTRMQLILPYMEVS